MEAPRTGVLLVNLGSPASPGVGDVRRYLREFLSDPYVLDMPAPVRAALLHGVILRLRPRRSAEAYRKIWTAEGSPLLIHGRALRDAVSGELGPGYVVELAMRYGTPSIRAALQRLGAADVMRILALPLYPQYAAAATGSSVAKLEKELERAPELPPHEVLPPFYADPQFIAAWGEVARPELATFRPDYVLFSYHGLPVRQVRSADRSGSFCLARADCCEAITDANRLCYRAQCHATSRALAQTLALAPEAHGTAFQSRMGPTSWIEPHTDRLLPKLAAAGHRRLAVLCPAFVADCLETLEEIGVRAREQWRAAGGQELHLVPSLNAHPAWVTAVASWIQARA
jgi:ferrochelatase